MGFLRCMREYRKVPSISDEEVVALSLRVSEGDRLAWQCLVEAHMRCAVRYVWRISSRFGLTAVSLQDAVQIASLGLMRAAETYDASRGVRFTTYAYWWIRQYVSLGIMKEGFVVRHPTNVVQLRKRVKRATEVFYQSR